MATKNDALQPVRVARRVSHVSKDSFSIRSGCIGLSSAVSTGTIVRATGAVIANAEVSLKHVATNTPIFVLPSATNQALTIGNSSFGKLTSSSSNGAASAD